MKEKDKPLIQPKGQDFTYKPGGDIVSFFYIETIKNDFRAATLHQVMQLWKFSGDKTEVIRVGSSGV